jgi:hypothetical protein
MSRNCSRGWIVAIPLALLVSNLPVQAQTETSVPQLDIGKGASLGAGGSTVTVPIEVQCSARWEVLEAFVYIVQKGAQSSNATIPVDCGLDRPRLYNVEVSKGTAPFQPGEATATAYVLLQDTSGGGTTPLNDTATIIIRNVAGRPAPSDR